MYSHESRVRYCDVDRMGVVYHARFLDYWEWARTDMLRSTGLSYKEMEDSGIMLPAVKLNINYRKSAGYDSVLKTHVIIEDLSSAKIVFSYETYTEDDDLIVDGSSVHVFTNSDLKITRISKELVEKINSSQA